MNQKFPLQVSNLGVPDWYTNDLPSHLSWKTRVKTNHSGNLQTLAIGQT